MPLDVPPPRDSRFGSPLVLSRVHWVRPDLVAEVKYLTWTDDNLLPSRGCIASPTASRPWASEWVLAFFAYGISRSIGHRSTLSAGHGL